MVNLILLCVLLAKSVTDWLFRAIKLCCPMQIQRRWAPSYRHRHRYMHTLLYTQRETGTQTQNIYFFKHTVTDTCIHCWTHRETQTHAYITVHAYRHRDTCLHYWTQTDTGTGTYWCTPTETPTHVLIHTQTHANITVRTENTETRAFITQTDTDIGMHPCTHRDTDVYIDC